MDLTKIRSWLGETTTIQGLAAIGGGVAAYLSGSTEAAIIMVIVGVIGIVLRETPAQVIATARSLIGQAEQVKVEAGNIAGGQPIVGAVVPPPSQGVQP